MMKIINLTPHPINLIDENGRQIRVFESEGIVRLKAETVSAGKIDGIALTTTKFGEVEGLPGEVWECADPVDYDIDTIKSEIEKEIKSVRK